MARITPCIKDGLLRFCEESVSRTIAVESEAWWEYRGVRGQACAWETTRVSHAPFTIQDKTSNS